MDSDEISIYIRVKSWDFFYFFFYLYNVNCLGTRRNGMMKKRMEFHCYYQAIGCICIIPCRSIINDKIPANTDGYIMLQTPCHISYRKIVIYFLLFVISSCFHSMENWSGWLPGLFLFLHNIIGMVWVPFDVNRGSSLGGGVLLYGLFHNFCDLRVGIPFEPQQFFFFTSSSYSIRTIPHTTHKKAICCVSLSPFHLVLRCLLYQLPSGL